MRKQIQKILAELSRRVIAKYNPKVIGVTGSVGKTSTKRAIEYLLDDSFNVRASEKNFNNEFGVPFTILGVDSPGKNPFLWMYVFTKGLFLSWFPFSYPEVLILEMGVDRPGDMDYLLSIVRPQLAVITAIEPVHYEFFESIDEIAKEKAKLALAVPQNGYVLLNVDNDKVAAISRRLHSGVITYGLERPADVRVVGADIHSEPVLLTDLSIKTPEALIQARVGVFGASHFLALSAAVAVAELFGVDRAVQSEALSKYEPEPGRLNILPGLHGSVLLDDTYNASPASVKLAIETLVKLPQPVKIVVLGDMLELGDLTESAHEEIGKFLAEKKVNFVITMGEAARLISDAAREAGIPAAHAKHYTEFFSAVHAVQKIIGKGSVVLIKGSQGMRMEKITLELMAHPEDAPDLLCRQYGKWVS